MRAQVARLHRESYLEQRRFILFFVIMETIKSFFEEWGGAIVICLAIGGCVYYGKNDKMPWGKADKEWGETDDGVYEIKDDKGSWGDNKEITYSLTLTYVGSSTYPFFILKYDWTGNLQVFNIWMEDEQGNILHKINDIHSITERTSIGGNPNAMDLVDRDLNNKTCTLKGKMHGMSRSIAERTKKMRMRASFYE
jgi:hypothetical protein